MKKSLWIVGLLLTFSGARLQADMSCGDGGISCGEEEHCCEHVIAMFSDDHAVAPSVVQGQCIPKEQKCVQFWCGNRECKAGFFGAPSVCCVNTPDMSSTPQYSCAYSELSCPGNNRQLSIRESQPTRNLQRG